MAKRTISVALSTASINKAIKELEAYKAELNRKVELLIKALVDEGVEIAKVQVRAVGANVFRTLEGSIQGFYNPATGKGFIYAGAWYVMYVEFGTGIVGKESPHPDPGDWAYDVNEHGEDGWWYGDDQWTKGMPARPFMYNTGKELAEKAAEVARREMS